MTDIKPLVNAGGQLRPVHAEETLPVANGGTGATTAGAARTALGLGTSATQDTATAAQFRANTADKALDTDAVWAAADEVALADGAMITADFSAGINFGVTLGGNRSLAAPTNAKPGQAGVIYFTQDGTGSRTLTFNAAWKFAGGTDPVMSTAAGAVDALFYQVRSAAVVFASLGKAFA